MEIDWLSISTVAVAAISAIISIRALWVQSKSAKADMVSKYYDMAVDQGERLDKLTVELRLEKDARRAADERIIILEAELKTTKEELQLSRAAQMESDRKIGLLEQENTTLRNRVACLEEEVKEADGLRQQVVSLREENGKLKAAAGRGF